AAAASCPCCEDGHLYVIISAAGRCGTELNDRSVQRSPEKRNSDTDEFRTCQASPSALSSSSERARCAAATITPAEVNTATVRPEGERARFPSVRNSWAARSPRCTRERKSVQLSTPAAAIWPLTHIVITPS